MREIGCCISVEVFLISVLSQMISLSRLFSLQTLQMTHFLRRFIDENPLCVCSDDISRVKKSTLGPNDTIKLKQGKSQVVVKLNEGSYHITATLQVPDEYPLKQLGSV